MLTYFRQIEGLVRVHDRPSLGEWNRINDDGSAVIVVHVDVNPVVTHSGEFREESRVNPVILSDVRSWRKYVPFLIIML